MVPYCNGGSLSREISLSFSLFAVVLEDCGLFVQDLSSAMVLAHFWDFYS